MNWGWAEAFVGFCICLVLALLIGAFTLHSVRGQAITKQMYQTCIDHGKTWSEDAQNGQQCR